MVVLKILKIKLKIKELNLYANLRPCKNIDGIKTPFHNVDIVVVRENTEDLYAGIERQIDENSECRVITVDDLDVPYVIKPTEIYVNEKKYSRAKKKQENKRLIDKYYEEER